MFIAAHASQLLRAMSFIGNVNNSYTEFFIRNMPPFLDWDFLTFDFLPVIKSGSEDLERKGASIN
jgi:hypothetical protein